MYFRIFHPTADPVDISHQLALAPERSCRVGAPRQTPVGTPLEGTYKETLWSLEVVPQTESTTQSLADSLAAVVLHLEPHHGFFRAVWAEGGRVEFYVFVHGPSSYGFSFDPDLQGAMSRAGISLGLEVLPVAERKSGP
jgi:hypothetical protein